jgi:hypothetical protein
MAVVKLAEKGACYQVDKHTYFCPSLCLLGRHGPGKA